jgi:hypothetical protein
MLPNVIDAPNPRYIVPFMAHEPNDERGLSRSLRRAADAW